MINEGSIMNDDSASAMGVKGTLRSARSTSERHSKSTK